METAIENGNKPASFRFEVAIVVGAVLAAFIFRAAIDPFIGDRHQYVPAYAAMAAVTWLSGWRAGAITALACVLLGEQFRSVTPADSTAQHVAVAFMGYLGVSMATISGTEWLRRDRLEVQNTAAAALAADRRKSAFLGLLGHELRDPLECIVIGGKLLKSGELGTAATQGTLAIIERQAKQMSELVGDLLDVSRLQAGKLSLHREVLDLSVAVQEAVLDVRTSSDARQQRLLVSCSGAPGFIYADPVRLRQMLANLLQNAFKFSPARSEIEVIVTPDPEHVAISIKDAGIGIPASQLQRIFEPFVQLERGAADGRGLGLGLPLTRELARMHGGDVVACSAGAGRGAQFVLTLPRALPIDMPLAAAAVQAPAATPDATTPSRATVAPRCVMVVDDNPDAAATLALLLRLKGHQALTAADGKEALQIASRQHPDLVFLDIGLPDMTGLEVARKLRGLLGTGVTLVALTGWGSQEDQRRSHAAGFDVHLTKPVDLAAIDGALQLAAAARAVSAIAPPPECATGLDRGRQNEN